MIHSFTTAPQSTHLGPLALKAVLASLAAALKPSVSAGSEESVYWALRQVSNL